MQQRPSHIEEERFNWLNPQRLDLALDAVRIGISDWDISHDVLAYSPSYSKLIGCAPEQLPHSFHAWLAHVHPDDTSAVEVGIKACLQGEQRDYLAEFRYQHGNGSWIWLHARGQVMELDAYGCPMRFTGVHVDISARKEAEAALAQERKFTDAIMDSVPGMLYLYDADGRLVRWNRRHEELTGYSSEELSGMTLLGWYDNPEDIESISAGAAQCLREGYSEADANLRNKDGTHTLYHFTAVRLEADGQFYFAGIGVNVQEQRRIELDLKASEQRYRSLFDNMLHGFSLHEIMVDESGKPYDYRYLDANPAFGQQTGLTRDICVGHTILELLPDIEPHWIETFGRVALQGETLHYENEAASLGKHFETVAFSPVPGQFAVLSSDITEKVHQREMLKEANRKLEDANRKLEETNAMLEETNCSLEEANAQFEEANDKLEETNAKLEETNAKLEEANARLEQRVKERTHELEQTNLELEMKMIDLERAQNELIRSERLASIGELVAGVAHEISTPVGVGVTTASFLECCVQDYCQSQHAPLSMEQERFLHRVKESSGMLLSNLERAARLINSFKQVSIDRTCDRLRTINVRDYVDEIILSLIPTFKKTPHRMVNRIDADIQFTTHPGALSQILSNLMANALQHAFTPDMQGLAEVGAVEEENRILLLFEDNGNGMESETLSHVFDPFYTTSRANGNSGLGLFIVHNLVTNELNGTIECMSLPGKGTSFRMILPKSIREG